MDQESCSQYYRWVKSLQHGILTGSEFWAVDLQPFGWNRVSNSERLGRWCSAKPRALRWEKRISYRHEKNTCICRNVTLVFQIASTKVDEVIEAPVGLLGSAELEFALHIVSVENPWRSIRERLLIKGLKQVGPQL
jgi:hypothetical protein